MKLGLGLYRHLLTPENFRFAKQAGATHIVAHLTDYFSNGARLPSTTAAGWGVSANRGQLWTLEELQDLRAAINAEGLELEAIENFDPSHWYDVLLDGPRKREQLEDLKTTIRRLGQAGIPIMGYCFSLAGVWGWVSGPYARGGAESVGFRGTEGLNETPIPNGMVWNMTYDPDAPPGTVPPVAREELWGRLKDFLTEIVPVAEQAGVRLAAHPDDPPMPALRGQPRLAYQPQYYQQILDAYPSPNNTLEFCIGTLSEMSESNIYEVVDHFSKKKALGYVHFRNVRGKVPNYSEVFIDEGDTDMIRALNILKQNGYDGVLIPDHTPQMSSPAPWHTGMAFALGYMRAAMRMLQAE